MSEQCVVAVPPGVPPALPVAGIPRKAIQLAEDTGSGGSEEGAADEQVDWGAGERVERVSKRV